MVTRSTPTERHVTDFRRVEPIPDPPREHDMRQPEAIHHAYEALRPHFPKDTLVSGGGFLLFNAGEQGEFYPNILIAMGVRDPRAVMWRNGYVISEVGKPPDFVMEVASRSTGRLDYTMMREGYARYGVREYWRFDPSGGEWHDAPLAGDVLVDMGYVRVEIMSEPDGSHWGYSEVLGLELWWVGGESSGWEGGDLRFRDP
ncbi:MAG: Uma2 family endonuclease, partial [Dehalococcoidia bacterium]|nr:Uma2 family endonuclease [Dehalococcoidia bacterium]